MIAFIMSVYEGFGISQPFLLHIITSATFTFALVFTVVLIGRVIDVFELGCMRMLTRVCNQKLAIFVCDRLTFPGVIIHELSHALFIWAAGGKITKIRFLTLGLDGRLGYVDFQPKGTRLQRSCQLSFGSCAPVLVGILLETLFMYVIFHVQMPIWGYLCLWYLAISVLNHMSMSVADMKNYLKGLVVIFPIIMVVVMARIYFFM